MLRNVLSGIAVGMANIIPGVSGGTMIVILGIFDEFIDSISNIFKKKSLLFLGQVFFGVAIGIVSFAKLFEFLFENYTNETIYWFIGLIIFSIPMLIKKEMKDMKISVPFLLLGLLVIAAIGYFAPEEMDKVVKVFPSLTFLYVLEMFGLGIVAGATTIFPGISGSMVMLIIGRYYLYKSYLANVTSFDANILIPLFFIGSGILVGIFLGGKLTNYLIKSFKAKTMSVILGLVVMSSLRLRPIDNSYDGINIVSYICSFLLGGMVVLLIEKISQNKKAV